MFVIKSNAICPAIIDTPIIKSKEMALELVKRGNPSERLGDVFEVVNAVEFLLCPRSTFVTG